MSAPETTRFTALPDEETLAATVVALEEHGFRVDIVDDLDAAREAVLARIPAGSTVMTNTSVTLDETGIAEAINTAANTTRYAPRCSRSTTPPSWRR
jgi:LUD domain